MAAEKTEPEHRLLLAACRRLMQRALDLARAGGASPQASLETRKAACHVELALLGLESCAAPAAPAGGVQGLAASLTSRILRQPAGEEPPAAALPAAAGFEGAAGGAGREGFSGYSWSISLPDLLGFLQMHEKSGVLAVETESETFSIGFERGELAYAISDNSPKELRLGEILIARGAVSREALEAFLARGSTGGKLGQALEREELVTREQLGYALEHQVQQTFHRLFNAENARFSFREGRPRSEDGNLRMNVMQLLLESARVKDESAVA
jgi:hypothetical protein